MRDIQADNGSRIKNPILAAMRFKPMANQDELEEKTQELLLSSLPPRARPFPPVLRFRLRFTFACVQLRRDRSARPVRLRL